MDIVFRATVLTISKKTEFSASGVAYIKGYGKKLRIFGGAKPKIRGGKISVQRVPSRK